MENFDLMTRTESQKVAKGGTELMQERIYRGLNREILEKFQIWFSRFDHTQFDPKKLQILYCHDLPGDPMYEKTLSEEGRKIFLKILFVSNWQMQLFINHYKLNWSQCFVMQNAIEPFEEKIFPKKLQNNSISLVYHTTPHRGLEILAHVFENLSKKYPITLDVFSSYEVYGQPERDRIYFDLFSSLKRHPQIKYHAGQKNNVVRSALVSSHIFAYPSIWPETSCLSLIEAMSAGVVAVHPNFGGLYETAANNTVMYQMQESRNDHIFVFQKTLENTIKEFLDGEMMLNLANQAKNYADNRYSLEKRIKTWRDLLTALIKNNI